jgi:hypothetical protein
MGCCQISGKNLFLSKSRAIMHRLREAPDFLNRKLRGSLPGKGIGKTFSRRPGVVPSGDLHMFEAQPSGAAEDAAKKINDGVGQRLPFTDKQDFEDARRGFMGPLPDGR